LSNPSYMLVVTQATREQRYEEKVCRRLGVAVISGECLLLSKSQTVWVI
jgi:hypothetical protein